MIMLVKGHAHQLGQRPQRADARELVVQACGEQRHHHAQHQPQHDLAEGEAVGHQQPERHHHDAEHWRGNQATEQGALGGHGWRISGAV
ncbi:hypothetical protein, partial [Mycobacterium tuberculosis]|uniref:hypothetical protein n=1 Tax=Mycobacterium tuberculosis TaxID=1773 RepID=UPI001BE4806E